MRDAFHEQLGRRIRSARDGKMTQEQLAERVGLSRTAITNIECGRQRLLVDQLIEIADALEVSAADLLPSRDSTRQARSTPTSKPTIAELPTVARWIRSVTRGE